MGSSDATVGVKAGELDTQRIAVGFDQTAVDDAARKGFGNGASEDSEDDSHVVIEESFGNTEAASTKIQGKSLPTPNTLADKLKSLASRAN